MRSMLLLCIERYDCMSIRHLGSTPVESWYAQGASYNYSSPGYSSSSGGFTQVVWAATTQLGVGIAFTSNSLSAYIAVFYTPPGNMGGAFATNVLAGCSSNTTTIPSTTVSPMANTSITMSTASTAPSASLINFQQGCLQQHNYRRQLHCVPSLVLNATLNAIAQNYANYLAANRLFLHSGAAGLGENLWMTSSSSVLTTIPGRSQHLSI
jgi:glioma pathogenesis-related protein 2